MRIGRNSRKNVKPQAQGEIFELFKSVATAPKGLQADATEGSVLSDQMLAAATGLCSDQRKLTQSNVSIEWLPEHLTDLAAQESGDVAYIAIKALGNNRFTVIATSLS